MKLYCTEFKAICSQTGELKTYAGPEVKGLSNEDAQKWCYNNAGHLTVIGELMMNIDYEVNDEIDYEKIRLN
jgi:hypothetical protein